MVQILLRMSDRPEDWGLVELQGQLETRHQAPFDNMHIGDLHFDAQGTPSLIIGHHLLTGKVVKLDKPFAVLGKRLVGASDQPGSYGVGGQGDGESSGESTEYEIVALITRKIIFKNRPKPIITKTQPIKTR